MTDLIEKTIEKIKTQGVTPDPRWKYLVKKYGLWVLFAMVVVLAAISFSVAYDNASGLDWDLHRFMHQNRVMYFLSIVPYFWIFLIGVFLLTAFFEIRKTETGYRYSWSKISLMIIGGIVLLGASLSFFGLGNRFHSVLAENYPYYSRHMVTTKESQWMQPEKGFLAGTIYSVLEKEVKIEDLDGENWDVFLDEKTLVRPSVGVEEGKMIKIIGRKKSEQIFEAEEIRPWEGRGMMRTGRGGHSGGMRRN